MPPTDVPLANVENVGAPQNKQQGPSRALLIIGIIALCASIAGVTLVWFANRATISEKEHLTIGVVRYLKIYDPEIDGFVERMNGLGYQEGEGVTYRIFRVD